MFNRNSCVRGAIASPHAANILLPWLVSQGLSPRYVVRDQNDDFMVVYTISVNQTLAYSITIFKRSGRVFGQKIQGADGSASCERIGTRLYEIADCMKKEIPGLLEILAGLPEKH
ncbi:hypothetical protein FZI27_20325 [Cronobacter sakazakii]|nr:hypothetical protein FZI27_20325 [Cronobacter sakazakii]